MSAPLLRVAGLTRHFGGLAANDGVNLEIGAHEVHALIGPNGAGKTTFIGLVAGELFPEAGSIHLAGNDMTRRSAYARALAGIGRSFQITSVLGSFSVHENVAIAAQAHDGNSFRFWRPAHRDARLNERANAALARVGLDHRADSLAATLSHGEHRLLEIAMALAGRPKLLLMDEPTSGMGPQESRRMIELLRSLRGGYGILLIEHDMDIVFAVADRITVLGNGRVVACGTPDAIRSDPAVQKLYLGAPDSMFERPYA